MTDLDVSQARLLIVDDELPAVENLGHVCRKTGYQVETCLSGQQALDRLAEQEYDVVLTDLRMEQVDGMEVLKFARLQNPDCAVILITGYATLDSAIAAMKEGAFHYIAKPFRLDEVREVVRHAVELVLLKRENRRLSQMIQSESRGPTIITHDDAMQHLLQTAQQVAITNTNVLIYGESGTGKELLARYIHAYSDRREQQFHAINCGALQEDLLASELFGHEAGAFTGAQKSHVGIIEAADGGTLFLDEIGEMSLAMQVKLLRVIQQREVQRVGATRTIKVDIRLIAATHRQLIDEVAAGRFREDLYYRLDVVNLKLPPLVDRREDVPLLAYYFLRKYAMQMGKNITDITSEAMQVLVAYDYPGNIRELENLVQRAVTLTRHQQLQLSDLPGSVQKNRVKVVRNAEKPLQTLAERERDYISLVLDKCEHNRTKAAKVLGIDRVSLWRKLKKYGMVEE